MLRKHWSSQPKTITAAERRRRSLGQRRLDVERLERRELLALLSSGTGEGHLNVQVNEFGAFGRSGDLAVASPLNPSGPREVNDAFYDPIGPRGSAGTTFESGLAVKVGADPVVFLTAGTIANSGGFTNGLFNVPVDPTSRVLNSTFFYPASAGPQGQGATLRFDVRQELIVKFVSGTAPIGVTLRQTYTVTNLTATTQNVEIYRYYDGDILYDSNFLNNGAGMRQVFQNEPERVWMTNTATNTNRNEPAYVEIRSNLLNDNSGVPTNRVNRWEVGEAMGALATTPSPPYSAANPGKNQPSFLTNAPLVSKILAGGPLSNDIVRVPQADIDGNNKVDNTAPDDWAVALRNVYTITGLNASIVYVADTQFGDPEIGDPEPIIIPDPQRGTITGTKFSDTNNNGVRDAGELGVSGFRIYADVNNNNRFDAFEPSAVTDVNGFYSFVVPVGTYNVREVQQAFWTQTYPATGFYTVTLVSGGDIDSGNDFGNHATPGSASGMIFEDLNKNGRLDAGEVGLGSVLVYADINMNGTFEANEPNTLSAAGTGVYTLPNLDPRTYVIRQVTPAGYNQTAPAGNQGHIISVQPGQAITGLNFGNVLREGQINGKIWVDTNDNGLIDAGEPGAAGVIVWVDRDNDCKIGLGENAIYTGADGLFGLYGIRPGTYNVRISLPAGYDEAAPLGVGGCAAAITVTVQPGLPTGDVNFLIDQIATLGPDFGDAPAPYPTTLAQNGARHELARDFGLGLLRDGEPDGQPSPLANGDDVTGIDDEDGVVFSSIYLTPGGLGTAVVTVQAVGRYPGKLQGFIDFNRDGDWDDAGERIVLNLTLPTGTHTINFAVPSNAVQGATFARFRYGYEHNLGPTGPALIGEVEDYRVFIVGSSPVATPNTFNLVYGSEPSFLLDVLFDDIPSANGSVSISAVTQPGSPPTAANGTVTIEPGNAMLRYTPTGLLQQETFTYTITDSAGKTSTATVTVNLTIPPAANDDAYLSVPVGSTGYVLGPANGLASPLANDFAGVGTLRIVGVNKIAGDSLSTMTLDTNTNTLIYNRVAGFAGVEQFQYIVVNDSGLEDTATITIQVGGGAADALVDFQIELLDVNMNPIPSGTQLAPDQEFFVRLIVDDLRSVPIPNGPNPDARGVAAAYLDLIFDRTRVAPVPLPTVGPGSNPLGFDIDFGSLYGQLLRGDIDTPGVIDEVGAFQSSALDPTGSSPVELFTVRFRVLSTATNGQAMFLTDPSDLVDETDVLLFQPPDPAVPATKQRLSQATIVVNTSLIPNNGPQPEQGSGDGGNPNLESNDDNIPTAGTGGYRNPVNHFDVDRSGSTSPLDALIIINMLNNSGSHSLVGMANPSKLATPYYYDVDGNDFLSPLDALLVITQLNSRGSSEASLDAVPQATSVSTLDVVAPIETLAAPATSSAAASITVEPGASVTLAPFESTSTSGGTSLLSSDAEDAAVSALLGSAQGESQPQDFVYSMALGADFGLSRGSASSTEDEEIDAILADLTLKTCLD